MDKFTDVKSITLVERGFDTMSVCKIARNKKGGGIVTHRQYCNLQPLRYC